MQPFFSILIAAFVLCLVSGWAKAQQNLYSFKSMLSSGGYNWCIDIPASQYAPGTAVAVANCRRAPNQMFSYESGVNLTAGGLCLDGLSQAPDQPASAGDLVGMAKCAGSAGQIWVLRPFRSDAKVFSIANPDNLCATVASEEIGAGTPLIVAECEEAVTQGWIADGPPQLRPTRPSAVAPPAEIKRAAFPKIEVDIEESYTPTAAFQSMQKAFREAVAKKDIEALLTLVGSSFVWMVNNVLSDDYDPGRDALHNAKVVFGFREPDKDTDGGVKDGPFWDALAVFANDDTFFKVTKHMVCSPIQGKIRDDTRFEEVRNRISEDRSVDWYFVVADATMTDSPTSSTPAGTIAKQVVPVLGRYPPDTGELPVPPITHLEVLLPTGEARWIPVSAARPLETDRLCYAVGPNGQWKIVLFDQIVGAQQ